MGNFVDFQVRSGPAETLNLAEQALVADGFRTGEQTEWTRVVETGSSGNRALIGGFAERSVLRLSVFDGGEGSTVLRIEKEASGWSGGFLGAQKASKAFEAATQRVSWSLQNAGHLA